MRPDATCELALKEWAVVVDALGEGRACVLFRKGGIAEPGGNFAVAPGGFFLLPTRLHQNRDALRTEFADGLPASDPAPHPNEGGARIEFPVYAETADWFRADDLAPLRALEPLQCLNSEAIERRFAYGRERGLFVLLLRARRLRPAPTAPNLPEYEGCKSWVALREPILAGESAPAIGDERFAEIASRFAEVARRAGNPATGSRGGTES